MNTRPTAVAGMFYPADASACRADLETRLAEAERFSGKGLQAVGGIVPHAGWMCSGAVAGGVIRSVAESSPETVVVFGAVHRPIGPKAAVCPEGVWETPIGAVEIDDELAGAVLHAGKLLRADAHAHGPEHSIEVQTPFVHHLMPKAKLLAVMTPPNAHSADVGRAVAEAAERVGRRVVFLGSTDLTHYGPRYGFTPMGVGDKAIGWAKDVNDRRMIDLMLAMNADAVVEESQSRFNACGGGAIAATIAACRAAGADRAVLLKHTNSAETLRHLLGASQDDAVGYAGVIFARHGS